jgi:hypothetical protein
VGNLEEGRIGKGEIVLWFGSGLQREFEGWGAMGRDLFQLPVWKLYNYTIPKINLE